MYKCWEMLPRIQAVCERIKKCEDCFMNTYCPMNDPVSVYHLTEERLKEIDVKFVEFEQEEGRFPLLISEIAAMKESIHQAPECKKKLRQFYLTRDNISELNKLFDAGWHISDEVKDDIGGKDVRNLVLMEN